MALCIQTAALPLHKPRGERRLIVTGFDPRQQQPVQTVKRGRIEH